MFSESFTLLASSIIVPVTILISFLPIIAIVKIRDATAISSRGSSQYLELVSLKQKKEAANN